MKSKFNAILSVLLILTIGAALVQTSFAQRRDRKQDRKEEAESRILTVSQVKSGVAPDGRGKLWAVVIGVSSYKNLQPNEQLRFAHRDAEQLAEFLRSPAGGGFPSSQIKVLLNQDATIAAIRTALGSWLARSAEKDDVIYIFFAGHGVVEDNDAYLMDHDSDPQNLYATSLSVAELNSIFTERVQARVKVLITDACHAGKIGLASRGTAETALINRYLDEVGKSGAGTLRLLASRENELSYENERWGGGHGVFTHFLLEGLRGQADRDHDGVVRASEILEYLSEVVPNETTAKQHPRAAGNLDARLPLAVLNNGVISNTTVNAGRAPVALEVRGPAGSEVYIDATFRGRIRPNGILLVEGLSSGTHKLSVDAPGAPTHEQNVALNAAQTVLDLQTALPANAASKSSPLVAQIRQALKAGQLLEPNGAWALYQQLVRTAPAEPQRKALELELRSALEETGQQATNNYVRTSAAPYTPAQLRRAYEAYAALKTLAPNDAGVEAKWLFAAGRVALADGKPQEALTLLQQSMSKDGKTACPYNALGAAYEQADQPDKAAEFFNRAATLAPGWSLPRYRLGLQDYARGRLEAAARDFQAAAKFDPDFLTARWWLAHITRRQGQLSEAEREITELLRLKPDYAPAQMELGLIYEAGREYGKASKALDKYLKMPQSSNLPVKN
jgi:uncharacterized caspase-like protein/Flp pilus assembly protein TadD